MNNDLRVTKTVFLKASPEITWDALTDPEQVKQYLYGTDLQTDWEEGSEIIFEGEWNGKAYRDKGVVAEISPLKRIEYTYWSAMSGLKDLPENYSTITWILRGEKGGTLLMLSQRGFASEEARAHSSESWNAVLNDLRNLIEEEEPENEEEAEVKAEKEA